ncbi:MAG TPA: hypothetical protein VFS62_10140 [Chloroflexota bacterium]|jgi:hypothetical protein|nr:hypothetical protein [Chloroflexota bacterium]
MPISQFSVPVDDLLPEVRTSKAVERPDNLEQVLPNLEKEIAARPWLQHFLEDVRRGDKQAIFKLAVGSIVITAAAGAGYELGVAHGRDLKHLLDLLAKRRRKP